MNILFEELMIITRRHYDSLVDRILELESKHRTLEYRLQLYDSNGCGAVRLDVVVARLLDHMHLKVEKQFEDVKLTKEKRR